MPKEDRSLGVGQGGGTQLEARRGSRGSPQWSPVALALVVLALQVGCATSTPLGGRILGSGYRYRSLTPPESPDARKGAAKARAVGAAKDDAPSAVLATAGADAEEFSGSRAGVDSTREGDGASARPRRQARHAGKVVKAESLEGEGVGWPDGVGDGRPYEVPITLDYFQGFLVQAGVPTTAVPDDGRALLPRQAMELLPHLSSTPVTLGNFGLRRMAAHLLLEVAARRL